MCRCAVKKLLTHSLTNRQTNNNDVKTTSFADVKMATKEVTAAIIVVVVIG